MISNKDIYNIIIDKKNYHGIDRSIAELAKEHFINFCSSNYNVDNLKDIDYLRIYFYIICYDNINPLVNLYNNAIIKEFSEKRTLIKKFVKSVQEQYNNTEDKNNFFLNY